MFEELDQFGELENLNICDNLADHMVGNVYVKFREEESAAKALAALQGRFYNGRPIVAEFSPVTDFREATCRQYEENTCNRGGYCNFMHLKQISKVRAAVVGVDARPDACGGGEGDKACRMQCILSFKGATCFESVACQLHASMFL